MEHYKYLSKREKELLKMLDEVRMCTVLYCMKDGKIYCSSAEKCIRELSKYSKYCPPEMAVKWTEDIRKTIYGALVPKPEHRDNPMVDYLLVENNYTIIDTLNSFMDAGEIMEVYNNTKSWDEVDRLVEEREHSYFSFNRLLSIMIRYSSIGVQFVDRIDPNQNIQNKKFREYYDNAKKYMETRNDLNKRLVYAISRKID